MQTVPCRLEMQKRRSSPCLLQPYISQVVRVINCKGSDRSDIALLEISGVGSLPSGIRLSSITPATDAAIILLGNPRDGPLRLGNVRVGTERKLHHNVPTEAGSSGSVLLEWCNGNHWAVVGMHIGVADSTGSLTGIAAPTSSILRTILTMSHPQLFAIKRPVRKPVMKNTFNFPKEIIPDFVQAIENFVQITDFTWVMMTRMPEGHIQLCRGLIEEISAQDPSLLTALQPVWSYPFRHPYFSSLTRSYKS